MFRKQIIEIFNRFTKSENSALKIGSTGVEINLGKFYIEKEKKIEKVVKKEFIDVKVDLDFKEFIECKFKNSRLIYKGIGIVNLKNCIFENSKFSFSDQAALTLNFLTGIYHGMEPGGRNIVEKTFINIRNGEYLGPVSK